MAKSSPLIDFHTSNGAVFTERDGWLLPAHSGNPTRLDPKDAAACGADPATDSYMDDPRFVGIHDKGPIPAGRYTPRMGPSSPMWRIS